MLAEKLKEHLIQEIVKELNPAFIILYGSYAKGTNHERSDIDLAYFSDKKISNYERFILANKLSNLTEREVDLIDIKRIDTVFTIQIFSEGIPIYIADENTFIHQRMRAYRMYATLNEQRAPVIEAIKESGRVFRHE
ncbi:type VII toxin-antitoxin system MntA family adenylyltransferase antitoxin [Bacillaceae bacterium W0354]